MSTFEELLGLNSEDPVVPGEGTSSDDLLQTFSISEDDPGISTYSNEEGISTYSKTTSNNTTLSQTNLGVLFIRGSLLEGATDVPSSIKQDGTFFLDITNKNLWIDGKFCFPSTANLFSAILLTEQQYNDAKEAGELKSYILYCIPETS